MAQCFLASAEGVLTLDEQLSSWLRVLLALLSLSECVSPGRGLQC